MNKSPALQWYPRDILSSARVAALEDLEELWYRRALDYCWLNVTLPNDPAKLAKMVGRNCTVEGAKAILELFQVCKKDSTKVEHDRHKAERKKQSNNRRQCSEAGKKSAESKRLKKLEAQKEVNGRSTDVQPAPLDSVATEFNTSSSSSSCSYEQDKETHIEAADLAYPVKQLAEAFPNMAITPAMIGFLESEVMAADRVAWLATIKIYKMNYDPAKNRYLPDKTANVLGVFRSEKAKLEKAKNGTTKGGNYGPKRTDAEVFAESADFYANYPES